MRDVLLRRRHALEVTAIAMLPGERVVAPSEERAPQAAAARHGDDARLAPMQPGERPPIAQQPLPDGEMRGGAPLRRTHARPPPLLDSLRQRRKPVELTRLRRDLLREAGAIVPLVGLLDDHEESEEAPQSRVSAEGSDDAVPVILPGSALRAVRDAARDAAAGALKSLAADNADNRRAIRAAGGIEKLVHMLQAA